MLKLRKLSVNDNHIIYEMLSGIDAIENSFTNPVKNMCYQDFQKWLLQQEKWDKGESLPKGYVPQSIYWLYDENVPVGIGKIRHSLTEESKVNGGNIGYAISKKYRGKGYGNEILKMLLSEAHRLGIKEILLTIDKNNLASKRVCERNGGIFFDENDERYYFIFA